MNLPTDLPPQLQQIIHNGLLQRLPITFQPFLNQQLHEWDFLFPNERRSIQLLLLYVDSLTPAHFAALFNPILQLEDKMGVHGWQFSTTEQTILNASLLARSPYYQQWRQAVQDVFDASEAHALQSGSSVTRRRLVLLHLPSQLPVDKSTAWGRWQGIGFAQPLDLSAVHASGSLAYLLFGENNTGASLLQAAQPAKVPSPAQAWLIDAGDSLIHVALDHRPTAATSTSTLLGYKRLDNYRQNFSNQLNTMRRDLVDADSVYDRLRKVDVLPWCPPEASDPSIREFLRALYLSGNGAVIFGNSFVEWGASEALRRARPTLLAAQFDVRPRPKPFTGIAVFDNPDKVNPLPSVDDPQGSALDAQMLSLYIWLAALRFAEYQHDTVCICMAESIAEAYIVAPPEFPLQRIPHSLPLDTLRQSLAAWLA
jgi:hypothetical protein